MNSRSLSGGALAILVAVLIVSTEAHTRYCHCDLRYSTTRLISGHSIDNRAILADLKDPTYDHWLRVSCRRAYQNCPNDCLHQAHLWLGSNVYASSRFTSRSGHHACGEIKLNAPPTSKIYVYASYISSGCGGRSWQYITELCCWEISFPGYNYPLYVNNFRCAKGYPPSTGC